MLTHRIHCHSPLQIRQTSLYYITLKRTIISCPECGSRMNIKDYRKCKVMHNMIRGKNTFLILKKRRLVCPQCNKVVTEENPSTEKSHSRLSQTSEMKIMN
ncbi:transposase family protein [Catenibacterium sp.]|uniref:transposase family protein n=1 Tax=Catenibacterium sp. TaxID=2049022 RepID=UPI00258E309F|nr:transposase family protein [Catenibacterium sp.]